MCLAMRVMPSVPAHIIDKGISTAGLPTRVLVAKLQNNLPLYREEGASARPVWCAYEPLVDALKTALLVHPVPHADETRSRCSIRGGKTHRVHEFQSG